MPCCAVITCRKSSGRCNVARQGISFHRFPPVPATRQLWIDATGRIDWIPTKCSTICSQHFSENDYLTKKSGNRYLKAGAFPRRKIVIPFSEDTPQSEAEVIVFCPKCDKEVSHTAKGILEDQTKILIAKVYHYFEQEYEELKTIYGDLDLTPLSKFGQRTALATGVSETTVLQILKEEEKRNADKLQEPLEIPRSARKRSRQTDSSLSEEDSSDDNVDDNEQPSNVHEAQTLVVKVEPSEYYNEEPEIYVPLAVKVESSDMELDKELAQTDPIGVDATTEPGSDAEDNTNETLALNEPAETKRRARKIPRSDVTATRQHTQGESSTAAAASSVRLTEELDESSLFGDTELKAEEIEIHEAGPS